MVSTESRSWRQGQSTQRVCPAGLPHGMFHHHWIYKTRDHPKWASQVVLGVQNAPAKAGDIRDMSLIPGLGRSPGGGHANPLQHSCLENPMDRGVWKATVLGVTKSGHRMKHTQCPSTIHGMSITLQLAHWEHTSVAETNTSFLGTYSP